MQDDLQQVLAAAEALNKPDQPFSYRVEGNQIIGEWKYLDAKWAAPLAAGNVSKDFKFTVTLNEADHSYTSHDSQTQKQNGFSFNPMTGNLSFGSDSKAFGGHMTGKQFGFGVGKANQPQNETAVGGPTYQYNFDTAQIKKPLFDFLAQTGWKPAKKGFFSKLFGGN